MESSKKRFKKIQETIKEEFDFERIVFYVYLSNPGYTSVYGHFNNRVLF